MCNFVLIFPPLLPERLCLTSRIINGAGRELTYAKLMNVLYSIAKLLRRRISRQNTFYLSFLFLSFFPFFLHFSVDQTYCILYSGAHLSSAQQSSVLLLLLSATSAAPMNRVHSLQKPTLECLRSLYF